jgi:replication-associated recombination protein RarA
VTATLDNATLDTLRARRWAGEALGKLAKEIGLPWQRLWGLLQPPAAEILPVLRPNAGAGSLAEKYRPSSLDTIWGQEAVVNVLSRFADNPHSTAFVFEGETGTGKTSAALALAGELGCDLAQQEFGGVRSIASGEQSADAVRDAYRQMFLCPWTGSGWKVVIVNEADRMARPAETIWLDVLESLPPKTVIIFTTNEADRLSQRFLDRCTRLSFDSDADKLRSSAVALAGAVWKAETGRAAEPSSLSGLVDAATVDGQISFRRLMGHLTMALSSQAGGCR